MDANARPREDFLSVGGDGARPADGVPGVWTRSEDAFICSLDPLQATHRLEALPMMNARGDVAAVVGLLRDLVGTGLRVDRLSVFECCAAMRDIGICLGSIKRFGLEPQEAVAGLAPVLLQLGRRSDLPPRDNVLHYTVWNPSGAAQRRYTRLAAERCLVDSVRQALPDLQAAIGPLLGLRDLSVRSRAFGLCCDEVLDRLQRLIQAIVYARKTVSPIVFARDLRPYFEPIRVGAQAFKGPGAVEMPLFLLDHLLWSANCTCPEVVEFKETYLPDQRHCFREIYHQVKGDGAVLDRLVAELGEQTGARLEISMKAAEIPVVAANLGKLRRLFSSLLSFRAPHLRMAEVAYGAQSGTDFDKGSGGFPPSVLAILIEETRAARSRLDRLIAFCGVKAPGARSSADPSLGETASQVSAQGTHR